VIDKANHFENRKDLDRVEQTQVAPVLSDLFKSRIQENKKAFNQRVIEEYNLLHNIKTVP
jgi:hypothetical protein